MRWWKMLSGSMLLMSTSVWVFFFFWVDYTIIPPALKYTLVSHLQPNKLRFPKRNITACFVRRYTWCLPNTLQLATLGFETDVTTDFTFSKHPPSRGQSADRALRREQQKQKRFKQRGEGRLVSHASDWDHFFTLGPLGDTALLWSCASPSHPSSVEFSWQDVRKDLKFFGPLRKQDPLES